MWPRVQRDAPPGGGLPQWTSRIDLSICVAIVLAAFAAYSSVVGFGFVSFDDGPYVYANPHLEEGFTSGNLRWILLSFSPDNWFPVTRLSLLADYRLFGLKAGWYHAENVAIHSLACVFLFAFLRRTTGHRWPAAFSAFLFALHPLHVESVAWISERKDVLCALFGFAALWAWVGYVRRPGWARYLGALFLFACGLMSKPMLVTLPFLLVILDVWPFGRLFPGTNLTAAARAFIPEKLAFFALSFGVMAVTVVAQRNAGAITPSDVYPLPLRVANALISVPIYIADTVWPAHLWALYAYPVSVPAWQAAASALGLACACVLVLLQLRKRPWLAVGWSWFLGTLIPVIGLLQVGSQARADRYMYIPSVGLSIMLAWSVKDAIERSNIGAPLRTWSVAAAGSVVCIAMGTVAFHQTLYWQDSDTLFRHAIDMDARNYWAWELLAKTAGTDPVASARAIDYYRKALQINPQSVGTINLLGLHLARLGRQNEAIAEFRTALSIYPRYAPGHYNLGMSLLSKGQRTEAMNEFELALRFNPNYAYAHNELGAELWRGGRTREGLSHVERAVDINPDLVSAQYNLGKMLMDEPGRLNDSVSHFTEALRLRPLYLPAQADLGEALLRIPGRRAEAIDHLKTAQEISPDPARGLLLHRLESESSTMSQ